MILLSTVSVIRLQLCTNNCCGFRSCGLFMSVLGKLSLFHVTDEKVWFNLVKESSFKMLGLFLYSKVDWSSYNVSVAEAAFIKIATLIYLMKFLSFEVAVYLYKSAIAWSTVFMSELVLLVATWIS